MARSVRVEFPGAFSHVMALGNRREPIFLDQEDGKQFVKALGEVCAMTGWREENASRFAH
jgi:putative transposase